MWMEHKAYRASGVHVSASGLISVLLGCPLGVLSKHLFNGQLADVLSLPTGIAPLQPLANGKVAGVPAR